LQVIYDTNILLQILRNPRSIDTIESRVDLADIESLISIVTVAEIRSLAFQFNWGNIRRDKMEEVIISLPVLDISVPEILDRYVEIDCYSKGKHPTLATGFSAVKMGKNDLWIAATASVYECKLLTTDLDFQHLHPQFVDVTYISPNEFVMPS
jgi:tRNA(fMet)-specific endonuclease VapC